MFMFVFAFACAGACLPGCKCPRSGRRLRAKRRQMGVDDRSIGDQAAAGAVAWRRSEAIPWRRGCAAEAETLLVRGARGHLREVRRRLFSLLLWLVVVILSPTTRLGTTRVRSSSARRPIAVRTRRLSPRQVKICNLTSRREKTSESQQLIVFVADKVNAAKRASESSIACRSSARCWRRAATAANRCLSLVRRHDD
jgi:hypothetical protein